MIPPSVRAVFFDAGDTLIAYRRPLRILLQDFFIQHDEIVSRDALAGALAEVDSHYRAIVRQVRTVDQERRMWVEVGRDLLDIALPRRRDLYAQLAEWFSEGWKLMKVFRDVRPALRQLRRDGYRLAVVSNWEPSLEGTLDHLGLRHYFETVVTSAVEGVWKPDPRLFEIARERMGMRADEILNVGDHMERDVEAARHAGLHAVLLDRFDDQADFTPRVRTLTELAAYSRSAANS